jgi:hypothetical protein
MPLKIRIYRTIGVFVLIALTGEGIRAAPLTSFASDFETSVGAVSSVERAASRQCWWRKGREHCRSYGGAVPAYGRRNANESDYYVHDSSQLPFGSKRWWDQKESEGSLGRP